MELFKNVPPEHRTEYLEYFKTEFIMYRKQRDGMMKDGGWLFLDIMPDIMTYEEWLKQKIKENNEVDL